MIRDGNRGDLDAILDIYNDAILHTTAIYTYKPYTFEDIQSWYEGKVSNGYPVIVFEENGSVIGFASYGQFRTRPAYKYTIENSVYVHKDHRGKHVGTKLMTELIKTANETHYATMIAAIDTSNEQSVHMHEKLGFSVCGTLKKVGYKFGKWLDVTYMQYGLTGPDAPEES